jgi:hypothetical protein
MILIPSRNAVASSPRYGHVRASVEEHRVTLADNLAQCFMLAFHAGHSMAGSGVAIRDYSSPFVRQSGISPAAASEWASYTRERPLNRRSACP